MSEATRTGILGGAFDPVHQGHLDATEAARRALQLDEVLFIPTRVAPHRAVAPWASAYHRFAMLALATAHQETWLTCDAELRSSNPLVYLSHAAADGSGRLRPRAPVLHHRCRRVCRNCDMV